MSRWGDRDEREQEGAGLADGLSRSGGESRPRTAEHEPPDIGFGANRRKPILLRERSVDIRPSERATLTTLGRFQVVDAEDDGKNPAAVELGRLGGMKGGQARAKKLTKAQRKSIAKKAAAARWKKS